MFTIPDGVFDKYHEAVNALYNCTHIADPVTVVNVTISECPNCVPGSPSVYKPGGPIPFNIGTCPYCAGNNEIKTENVEEITLRVYPERKSWIKIGNIEFPDGYVQIIGKIENLVKIKQASYLILFPPSDLRYVLDSDLFPFGFGRKQFVAYCKKQ